MAGALIGDLTSAESQRFDEGVGATPCHGELILAFDPGMFAGTHAGAGEQMAEALLGSIVEQGARLPSARRFEARQKSLAEGVEVPAALYEEVLGLLRP
jgi:LDH2 family malate/lactate/ureidoglycolate dehydrogenase